jgi:hypothetical protein
MKFHSQESYFISDWNVTFISTPLSPFLVSRELFSSLELCALSAINVVSNYTFFPLPTTSVVFLFLVGFNVNGNIMLLVIWIFAIS